MNHFASVEEKTAKLKNILEGQNSLEDFISPLDPGLLLDKMDVEKAKVFTSKKMPLMLTWDTGALLFKVRFLRKCLKTFTNFKDSNKLRSQLSISYSLIMHLISVNI